jgi:hypothetical protein
MLVICTNILCNEYQGQGGRNVKPAIHLYVLLVSRARGALPPHLHTPSCGDQVQTDVCFTFIALLNVSNSTQQCPS